jgi:hypothetical protein
LYAFAESDSFPLRDRGANRDHRILEDPAGIEVWLGQTALADAGPSQSVEMGEGFEDAFAGEAIVGCAEFSISCAAKRPALIHD